MEWNTCILYFRRNYYCYYIAMKLNWHQIQRFKLCRTYEKFTIKLIAQVKGVWVFDFCECLYWAWNVQSTANEGITAHWIRGHCNVIKRCRNIHTHNHFRAIQLLWAYVNEWNVPACMASYWIGHDGHFKCLVLPWFDVQWIYVESSECLLLDFEASSFIVR